jgi:hypothetical protein
MELLLELIKSIFSGASSKVTENLLGSNKKTKNVVAEHLPVETTNTSNQPKFPATKRINQALIELGREGPQQEQLKDFNISTVLGLPNPSTYQNFLQGKIDLDNASIKKISDEFNIDLNWLYTGKGYPFILESAAICSKYQLEQFLYKNSLMSILFLKANSEIGEARIIIKINEWKYLISSTTWHISSNVGRGGITQLVDLYNLVNFLNHKNIKIISSIVEPQEFEDYMLRKLFIGNLFNKPKSSHWAEDFTDIKHLHVLSKDYKQIYGAGFTSAQYIILTEEEYNSTQTTSPL